MEEDLKPYLEKIISTYKKYKESERFHLFRLSSLIYDAPLPTTILPKIPRSDSPILLPYLPSKPSTTAYISTHTNIAAEEKEDLDFLPYDEAKNCVYYSPDLDIYKTNPFNQASMSNEFIENKQFLEFLVLSLLKYYPMTTDWMEVSNVLADYLGKSKRLMLAAFNDTINKYVHKEEIILKKQEFRENFCQICYKYACATHFYDEKVEYEEGHGNSARLPEEMYQENAMKLLDPDQWKIRWWSREKNLKKTGRWLLNYSCPNPTHCSKSSPPQPQLRISSLQKQLIKKLLKLGLRSPCAVSLFSNIPCKSHPLYLTKYQSKYAPPPPAPTQPKRLF